MYILAKQKKALKSGLKEHEAHAFKLTQQIYSSALLEIQSHIASIICKPSNILELEA